MGRTGVDVSVICLGCMGFGDGSGGKQQWAVDEGASREIIRAALEAGVNFFDTANIYSRGVSEEFTGRALRDMGKREEIVLATKVFMPMGDEPNHRGGSRRWIMRSVEDSLRRLGTDYIDLYQVHRPSQDTDVEETLGALTDLVRQGKIRYLGSSSYAASQIVEAQWVSRDRRLERFVTEQPPYSIMVRGIETDVLPTAQRHGMGILTYSPLGGGWLSGRWRAGNHATPTSSARPKARFDMTSEANQRKLEIAESLAQLAEQQGMTLIDLAIAFVINHPAVTAAIIGPRTMEQLESQLTGADVTLSTDILDRIDELVAPGVTVNPDDNSYGEAELTPAARRRTS